MATYRYVANDIKTSLKKQTDDSDIRLASVIYWIQVVANRIMVDQYNKTKSGLYTSTFYDVNVLVDEKDRKYVDLPGAIMDLPDEKGVAYISYNVETGCCCTGPAFAYTQFSPTTPEKSRVLYFNEDTEPSPKNPYFYRVGIKGQGHRIYLLGLECINVDSVEMALRCSLNPSSVCSLDDTIPVPDERIEELIKTVLELGRWVTLMPNERINQGSDQSGEETVTVPAPRPPMPSEVDPDSF